MPFPVIEDGTAREFQQCHFMIRGWKTRDQHKSIFDQFIREITNGLALRTKEIVIRGKNYFTIGGGNTN
jgi:hypothetical protein